MKSALTSDASPISRAGRIAGATKTVRVDTPQTAIRPHTRAIPTSSDRTRRTTIDTRQSIVDVRTIGLRGRSAGRVVDLTERRRNSRRRTDVVYTVGVQGAVRGAPGARRTVVPGAPTSRRRISLYAFPARVDAPHATHRTDAGTATLLAGQASVMARTTRRGRTTGRSTLSDLNTRRICLDLEAHAPRTAGPPNRATRATHRRFATSTTGAGAID